MPNDEDKSKVGERLTGVRDPKDPDGLLTVDQESTDPLAYGHEETDTLEKEQERNRAHGLG